MNRQCHSYSESAYLITAYNRWKQAATTIFKFVPCNMKNHYKKSSKKQKIFNIWVRYLNFFLDTPFSTTMPIDRFQISSSYQDSNKQTKTHRVLIYQVSLLDTVESPLAHPNSGVPFQEFFVRISEVMHFL